MCRFFARSCVLAIVLLAPNAAASAQLTGQWLGSDGTVYHVREAGRVVWWAGLSAESHLGAADFHRGYRFTNAFRGTRTGDTIRGEWTDVRRSDGGFAAGSLTIVVTKRGRLERVGRSAFPSSTLTRAAVSADPDMRERFDRVLRNDTASMHSHLRMYKDYATVTGVVVDRIDPSIKPTAKRSYANFLCNADGDFETQDNDGDLSFDIVLGPADRERLDWLRGFWTDGWRNDPKEIRAKLESKSSWKIESEIVMYGRPTARCAGDATPLLPGWMEAGANGVLLNGVPIAQDRGVTGLPENGLLNGVLLKGRRVRVTGALAIDCHAGKCAEDQPDKHNVELHPVFSIDVLRDTSVAPRSLSGMWDGLDGGTYYVQQIGNIVWWVGVSADRGAAFITVFRGLVNGSVIEGEYSELPPRGSSRPATALGGGSLRIDASQADHSTLLRSRSQGRLAALVWNKISDR